MHLIKYGKIYNKIEQPATINFLECLECLVCACAIYTGISLPFAIDLLFSYNYRNTNCVIGISYNSAYIDILLFLFK